MKNVLIIAAHPDDEVLGCGGMISKFIKQDVNFKILFVGEGSTCRFDDVASKEATNAISERQRYAVQAMKILGIQDFCFYNLPCGRFDQIPIIKINKIIEKEINEFKPDTIFTHSVKDTNNDHKIIFNSTLIATRPLHVNKVSKLFTYEVLSSSEWRYTKTFSPNYFISINENDILLKWKALECYLSEINNFPFPRSEKGLKTLAMYRGMQAGFEFAEAFELIRDFQE